MNKRVFQMMGRAGRPQFDTVRRARARRATLAELCFLFFQSGKCVIMVEVSEFFSFSVVSVFPCLFFFLLVDNQSFLQSGIEKEFLQKVFGSLKCHKQTNNEQRKRLTQANVSTNRSLSNRSSWSDVAQAPSDRRQFEPNDAAAAAAARLR